MGVNDNIYDKLQEYLGMQPNDINVLEENIDSGTQIEYFESSRNFNTYRSEKEIIQNKDTLLDESLSIETKKNVLLELASLNSIEAYRAIENYLHQPEIKLHDWACLALQESKLQLESQLLDENKVLITTGLGGQGFRLRYFIVFFTPKGNPINSIQQNIISKELKYFLGQYNSELEDMEFEDSFASALCLIPLNIPPQPIFHEVIKECNLFGNFLFKDFIITNMKAMDSDDIRELLTVNNIY